MSEENKKYRAALEAFLEASTVEAQNGVGVYAEHPEQTSVIYLKWAIKTFGITSRKVENILDSTYESFRKKLEYRSTRNYVFICVLRAFLSATCTTQLGDMQAAGLGVGWTLMEDLYEEIGDGKNLGTKRTDLEMSSSGLSCLMQCTLLSSNTTVQRLLLQMSSEIFKEKRSPLRTLSQAEVLVLEKGN